MICPLPECDDRRLVARGGEFVHDHFAHHAGAGGHGPESVAHWVAKHEVGAWLREQPGVTDVHVDDSSIETGQRPDVSARTGDGRLLAFEVQYAALSAEDWRDRHGRYERAGVIDTWLWGRPGRWLAEPDALGHHRFPRLVEAMIREQHMVRWYDPRTGELLAPVLEATGYRRVVASDLSLATLRDGRPWAPFDEESARRERSRYRDDGAIRVLARHDSPPRNPAPDPEPRRGPRDDEASDAWRRYMSERAAWLKNVKEAVYAGVPEDRMVPMAGPHWRALVLERLVAGHIGGCLTTSEMTGLFGNEAHVGEAEARAAAAAFAAALLERGYLGLTLESRQGVYEIVADADAAAVEDLLIRDARAQVEAAARVQVRRGGPAPGQTSLFD